MSLLEPPTVAWRGDAIAILEQTLLPREEVVLTLRTAADVIDAIRRLAVRGAPAIGVCAAYGVVVIVDELGDDATPEALRVAAEPLATARPTAVNLRTAVDHVLAAGRHASTPQELRALTLEAAERFHQDDVEACDRIGEHGRTLLSNAERLMTVCNAGRLAATGIGTALAPIYAKHRAGEPVSVLACETRPLLQGGRLTAWELTRAGVAVTVLADGAAAAAMSAGRVDAVITGCDRVAANGDVANKIGTYALAVLAHHHAIPFYVAGPVTTLDPHTPSGAGITVEQRAPDEVRQASGLPPRTQAWNPAFDVTPAHLITAIITDAGVLHPPYPEAIAAVAET